MFLSLLPGFARAGDFATGAVQASDGGRFYLNAIPQIARLSNGQLFTVWMAEPKAGGPSHIYGAFSADGGLHWSAPRILIQDPVKDDGDPNILVDGRSVLVFSTRVHVPNKIDKSWTFVTRSDDDGQTWSAPREIFIPRQYVSGKQANGLKLRNGTYLLGISWDKWPEIGLAAKTEGEMDVTAGVLLSPDGIHWTVHGAIHALCDKMTPGSTNGMDEPSTVELADGSLLMLLRAGGSHHYESRSQDGGLTWSDPVASPLPGHNTPSSLWRLDENPAEIIVICNNSPLTRYPLSTAISATRGKTWSTPRTVIATAGLQVSYPGITQASDHTFVAVWQQQDAGGGRDIRWARFTRDWVLGRP